MNNNLQQLVIRQPDDMHAHFRDGEDMDAVVSHTAKQFGRAIIMPNLKGNLVVNAEKAESYYDRIRRSMERTKSNLNFKPLMTIFLRDITTPQDIVDAKNSSVVYSGKTYPANATTNSEEGVTNFKKIKPVFREMRDVDLVLDIHGETIHSQLYGDKTRDCRVGQLRREAVFLKETLSWIVDSFPDLRIVLEHITTKEAVEFVKSAPANVSATITAHHLLETLDAALESHHNKCMPVLKEEEHRQALLDAATSGNPKFFCGTDTAPHSEKDKNTHCGCAGCFTGLHAVELYATAFEQRGALDKLEGFMSHFGADFYGLPRNTETITINRESWTIPNQLRYGKGEQLVPFWAGKTLDWKVA